MLPRRSLRTLLAATGAVAALVLTAAATPGNASESAPTDVIRDPHGDKEPSGTTIREIDGTNVVFAYDQVVPEFNGWDRSRHSRHRHYLSLDGSWKFRYDPTNVGKDQSWFAPDHDDSAWDDIEVPSAWDLKDNDGWAGYDADDFGKGGSLKDGYAWYRTTVDIPRSWRGTYPRLNFLGVFYSADIWIDGTWVGKHEGGHTSFSIPLEQVLRPGREATIAVRVYRRASYTSYDGSGEVVVDDYGLPSGRVDYWPYAGITRSVWLEAVPEVTIAKLLIDTPRNKTFDARVVVENHTDRPYRGKVLIDPGHGSSGKPKLVDVSVPAHGVAVPRVSIPLPAAPTWSPSNPKLLTAKATLVGRYADSLVSTYGVRTVSVADAKLLLNDEQIFLKGTNWHEENDTKGRAMTPADYDEELARLLDLGANFLRNAVYSRHPYSYDWTDRHGVMVLDEWDSMWITTQQQEIQLEYGLSRALAATTVWNNHNHPSVIMWGLENESTAETDTYRAWITQMKDAVKAVDLSDRPVTWATYTSWNSAFDLADVVGFNEYFGYFYGKNEDLGPTLDQVHQNHPDKPILITENGAWAWPLGNRGEPTETGTEDWQAGIFQSHWDQVVERPFMAGYAFWVYKDYKQRANYNMELNGLSGMGLTAWDGEYDRLVYDAFRAARSPR